MISYELYILFLNREEFCINEKKTHTSICFVTLMVMMMKAMMMLMMTLYTTWWLVLVYILNIFLPSPATLQHSVDIIDKEKIHFQCWLSFTDENDEKMTEQNSKQKNINYYSHFTNIQNEIDSHRTIQFKTHMHTLCFLLCCIQKKSIGWKQKIIVMRCWCIQQIEWNFMMIGFSSLQWDHINKSLDFLWLFFYVFLFL